MPNRSNIRSTNPQPEVNVQVFDRADLASNTRLEEIDMSTVAPTTTTSVPAYRPTRAGAPAAPAVRPPGRLVLTRRGRRTLRLAAFAGITTLLAVGLVLAWLAVAAVVAPGAVAGDGSEGVRSGATVAGVPLSTTTVVVEPGDTLWQIARAHAPGRDPRSVVDDVVALNDLTSTGVQVGARLLVPTD